MTPELLCHIRLNGQTTNFSESGTNSGRPVHGESAARLRGWLAGNATRTESLFPKLRKTPGPKQNSLQLCCCVDGSPGRVKWNNSHIEHICLFRCFFSLPSWLLP